MTKQRNVLPKKFRKPLKDLSVTELESLIGTMVHKCSGKKFPNGKRLAVVKSVELHPVTTRPTFVFESGNTCEAQACVPAHKVTLTLYKELLDMKDRFRFC